VAMVTAIEAAVRIYEVPPRDGMAIETEWADLRLGADDWAQAFETPERGTPHNEARDQVWEALLEILLDKYDGDEPPALVRQGLSRNGELRPSFHRAGRLLQATDVVGDLWSVPASLHACAPWLSAAEIRTLQRDDPQAWTVAALPLLDAARLRLGDAAARPRP